MLRKLPPAIRQPAHPILEPRTGFHYWWETLGVFNPGVTEYKGKIILLYRAYDNFRISRLGLAHSTDGITFTQYGHPAVDTDPEDPYERLGIEDPRVTKIDDVYYIIHTSASYNHLNEPHEVTGVGEEIPWRVRVGMHTTKDFKSYAHWSVILPDVPAKNACLLPEKINGQFGLYYREHTDAGEILKMRYTSDFTHWSDPQTVTWPTAEGWQIAKFGLGSQPISLPEGFLNVYHAVDGNRAYRLGLMLFDRQDPSRILWHSNPILEPEMPYEKEGYVPNVVYTCGAVVRGNELWIYYGAADQVIGRAVWSLSGLRTM